MWELPTAAQTPGWLATSSCSTVSHFSVAWERGSRRSWSLPRVFPEREWCPWRPGRTPFYTPHDDSAVYHFPDDGATLPRCGKPPRNPRDCGCSEKVGYPLFLVWKICRRSPVAWPQTCPLVPCSCTFHQAWTSSSSMLSYWCEGSDQMAWPAAIPNPL